MEFERLLLTKNSEFYRFSVDYNDVAYLLIYDSFSKASNDFGKKFGDFDFEANENHIIVKVGVLRELREQERYEINSFAESLLRFKPSIDYIIEFFEVLNELEFDYPSENGFRQLIEGINDLFNLDDGIKVSDVATFNNILQK